MQDVVDLVLRVAEINMDFLMAEFVGNCDLFTPLGAERILKSKLARRGCGFERQEAFVGLMELNGIPNVGTAVSLDLLSPQEFWNLRERKASRDFRQWLREADPKDTRDLERQYVAAIGTTGP